VLSKAAKNAVSAVYAAVSAQQFAQQAAQNPVQNPVAPLAAQQAEQFAQTAQQSAAEAVLTVTKFIDTGSYKNLNPSVQTFVTIFKDALVKYQIFIKKSTFKL